MPKIRDYTLEKIEIPLKTIIAHPWFRRWCYIPYDNNLSGCPNCERCSNKYSNFDTMFDLSSYEKIHEYRYDSYRPDIILIIRPFKLAEWSKKMLDEHREWTQKQANNSRYWQNGLMGILRTDCKEFCNNHLNYTFLDIPEATGVNLFATCRHNRFTLKKNPTKIINKMMMVGLKKGEKLLSLMSWFDEAKSL